jgi:uncharacterized protein
MLAQRKPFIVERDLTSRQFVNLLILQPTPFCNIDCDYCYLPERTSTRRMTLDTLERTIERVLGSGLVGPKLSIVWHAGEPLALPISFYEQAFQLIEKLADREIDHSLQTNGMLLNDRWCEFIKRHRIKVGVSIDGPAFIHDAHRKTRGGKGTHAQAMAGAAMLRKHKIDFHVIAVITAESLDHADQIFNFFLDQDICRVGFNIEEVEGVNTGSTLTGETVGARMKAFFERMHSLQKACGGRVSIREFDRAYQSIALSSNDDGENGYKHNDQVVPFGIISVDHEGKFSTFSPELLAMKSETYGDFFFGNMETQDIRDALESEKFQKVFADIETGVRQCAESCEYYAFCGGGAPSNKYYENGSFASTETMFCRYTIQWPLDIVLADLEAELNGTNNETRHQDSIHVSG